MKERERQGIELTEIDRKEDRKDKEEKEERGRSRRKRAGGRMRIKHR